MAGRSRRREGFTLIEVLVVVTIIGVLMGLLLPAIQTVRRRARQFQCANNLTQLALAVLNYETTHEVLPPGSVDASGPVVARPVGYHRSWLVQVLPYVEQKATYNHLNLVLGVYHPANATARASAIDTFLCPEDDSAPPSPGFERTSYAGCHHDVEAPIDVTNSGLLFLNSAVRIDDIEDGTSQTLLAGEKVTAPGDLGWASGTNATLRNTGTAINGPMPLPTPRAPAPVGGFGSQHPGVINAAFADGSVHTLRGGINPAVYRLLGHRADGEAVNVGEF